MSGGFPSLSMSLLYVFGMSMFSTFIIHKNHEEFECSIVCVCVCVCVCTVAF